MVVLLRELADGLEGAESAGCEGKHAVFRSFLDRRTPELEELVIILGAEDAKRVQGGKGEVGATRYEYQAAEVMSRINESSRVCADDKEFRGLVLEFARVMSHHSI